MGEDNTLVAAKEADFDELMLEDCQIKEGRENCKANHFDFNHLPSEHCFPSKKTNFRKSSKFSWEKQE